MANAKLSDSLPLTDVQRAEYDVKVEFYRSAVQKIHDQYWKEGKFNFSPGSTAVVEDSQRYTRVYLIELSWLDRNDHSKGAAPISSANRKQIHTFIDKLTGDVLKPASWKTPAKHARGNLFDPQNGLKTVNHYGPGYLR